MQFSGSETLIDGLETKAEMSKIKDLSDLSTTRQSLMLTLNISECDMDVWFGSSTQGVLAFNLEISVSNHHQLNMAFNGEQIPHLIIAPAQRLFGESVEILDFPPSQVVADDSLGCQCRISADQVVDQSL